MDFKESLSSSLGFVLGHWSVTRQLEKNRMVHRDLCLWISDYLQNFLQISLSAQWAISRKIAEIDEGSRRCKPSTRMFGESSKLLKKRLVSLINHDQVGLGRSAIKWLSKEETAFLLNFKLVRLN